MFQLNMTATDKMMFKDIVDFTERTGKDLIGSVENDIIETFGRV